MDKPGVPVLVRLQVRGQRMTVWALLMGEVSCCVCSTVLHLLEEMGRSDHLGHPRVCDCQFEVALVGDTVGHDTGHSCTGAPVCACST